MANTIGSRAFAAVTAYSLMHVSMAAVVHPDWPFEENAGRFDAKVAYVAHTSHGSVFVTRDADLVYAFGAGSLIERAVTPRHVSPVGAQRANTHISDFHGGDPSRWRRDVAAFNAVDVGEPWPGIDMQLVAHDRNVEKIYTLQPGISASRIRMRVNDESRLRVDSNGTLIAGDISFTRPVAYQTIDGVRRDVDARYVLSGKHTYSFAIGSHDMRHAVVIDPLIQTTYSGGSGNDEIHAMAIDPFDGAVVVVGSTTSNDFPGVAGGIQTIRPSAFGAMFIARYNPDLTTLIQATYLDGTNTDYPRAIAIHPLTRDVYVAGYTLSTDFPGTLGGAQSAHAGMAGNADTFVAQLSFDLKTLLQSTYLGGAQDEDAFALAIAPGGGIYVAGTTYSSDFPVQGAEQGARNGVSADAYVTWLSADLSGILASTYYGGTGPDLGYNLAIDPGTDDVILLGRTQSTDLPGRAGGIQDSLPGAENGFLARFDATLSTLQQATYLGGSGVEEDMDGIVIEPASHDIFVVGDTTSKDFPGTTGGYQASAGTSILNIVVSRLTSDLQSAVHSTYIGHDGNNSGKAIALDPASGDIFVTGQTDSPQFPGVAGGAQYINAGGGDAVTLRMSADLKTLRQSTYLGGSNAEQPFAIAIPTNGEVYIAGLTLSANFPGTLGGAQPNDASPGTGDGFIARYKRDLSELFESGFEVP